MVEKELKLTTRLAPVVSSLQQLSFWVLYYLNPALALNFFTSKLVDFWSVQNLLSLFFFILIASFVVINIGEDLYLKFKTKREYDELVK